MIKPGRSREGAWIEMAAYNNQLSNVAVAPVRERGLKLTCSISIGRPLLVAPVRERGLKYSF